jgi:hypothetical protein
VSLTRPDFEFARPRCRKNQGALNQLCFGIRRFVSHSVHKHRASLGELD